MRNLAEKSKQGWAIYASTTSGGRSRVTPFFETKWELAHYCSYKPILESGDAYMVICGITTYGQWSRAIGKKTERFRVRNFQLN